MNKLIEVLKEQFNVKENVEVIEELEKGLEECIPEIFKEVKDAGEIQSVNAFALRYLVLSDLLRRVKP